MIISLVQYLFSIVSGFLVGFSLGLIGGGGSILAIPLLLYFVGIDKPHIVIGTTALAVGITAYINFIGHFLMYKHFFNVIEFIRAHRIIKKPLIDEYFVIVFVILSAKHAIRIGYIIFSFVES